MLKNRFTLHNIEFDLKIVLNTVFDITAISHQKCISEIP